MKGIQLSVRRRFPEKIGMNIGRFFLFVYYLNIEVTRGPRGEKLLWSFPNSQINFCWQPESSKPRDSKRRSNLERSGSVFQSFICFWSSILLFFRLDIFLLLNSVLKPIEGKRKDTGTPINRSAKNKMLKAILKKDYILNK